MNNKMERAILFARMGLGCRVGEFFMYCCKSLDNWNMFGACWTDAVALQEDTASNC